MEFESALHDHLSSLFAPLFFERSLQRILDEECDQVLESLDMDFTVRHYCAIQTCHVPLQMTQLVCKLKLREVLCQALQKERMLDVAHLYLSYRDIYIGYI